MEHPLLVRDRFVALDALLATPEQWTQRIGARNIKGKAINPADPQAVCWCLLGGAFRVTRESGLGPAARISVLTEMHLALKTTLKEMGHTDITIGEYNDDSEFPDIKALIAKAISAISVEPDAAAGTTTDT